MGGTRTYSETSRKYETIDDYFDVLDKYKAYQLGLIFELGGVYKGIGGNKLNLSSKFNVDLMFEAFKGVTDKGKDALCFDSKTGVSSISINSSKLSDNLLSYGIMSESLQIPTEFMDNFIEGYLTSALTIHNRSIYISLGKSYSKSIIEYITDSLHIKCTIRDRYISIHNKDGIRRLILKFPMILNRVDQYLSANPTNTYWVRRKEELLYIPIVK